MASFLQQVSENWEELLKIRDQRVDGWFLMSSPWPSLLMCIGYVIVVTIIGPKFMEKREPYNIRTIMTGYNFVMVVLSAYIFMEFGLSGWFVGYSYRCDTVDYSTSEQAMRMVNVCWWFYFSKFIEFFDTIFFIMRKKYNQVSFLHVFHHGIMPISWWFGVKFVPGGFGTFHALLNSFIHFMMYIYYGLSGLGPTYQKYIWWKKYMTSMQITQFLLVCIHSSQLLFLKDCDYPKLFVYWIGLYALIFLVMFGNFYIQAYRKKPAKSKGQIASNGTKKD